MTSTSDSNSRDLPISSTDKVASIMVPVTDTSIVASVGSSLCKCLLNPSSSTTNVASISVQPNSLIVEHLSTSSTNFIGPLESSKVTILSSIFPKLSSVDKINSSSTTIVDPLPSSSLKLTKIIDTDSSIFDIDSTVSHIVIEDGSTFERLYELQIKNSCTIYELISIVLSQKDINVSRDRVMLVCCGKHLINFQVTDKLSDHGIKQDSVISMMMSSIITG